jgi:hypothetical protein
MTGISCEPDSHVLRLAEVVDLVERFGELAVDCALAISDPTEVDRAL